MKFYHQSGANADAEKSNNKFYSGETHKYIQVGNKYLEFDVKIRKDNVDNLSITASGHDIIRFVNTFAFTIHDPRISLSSAVEIEQNKIVGPFSTIMRLFTQKDVDLSTYFDIIDESEDGNINSSKKQILINNHTADNRGVIGGHLPLEYIFFIL